MSSCSVATNIIYNIIGELQILQAFQDVTKGKPFQPLVIVEACFHANMNLSQN